MIVRRFAVFACLFWGALATLAVADQPPDVAVAETEQPTAAASQEQIAEWIEQLDHDGFNIREAAQQKLASAGASAIEPLRTAALGDSQEAATRAVEVLKRHYQGDDATLKQQSHAALDKIAKSDKPIAVRRAEAALQTPANKPNEPPAAQPAVPVPFGGRGIRIDGGGVIKIEARTVINGKGRSVSVKNVDGNKEIDVEEDGRKIKIEESAEGKIKMSVTEKTDGKEETKSFEAESADDLKKVHPEAHKIYEQYKQGGGVGRIEFRALPAVPGPVPLPARIPLDGLKRFDDAKQRFEETRKAIEAQLPQPEAEKSSAAEQIDEAIEQLEATRRQFDEAGAGDAVKAAIEQLQKAKQQLEAAKAKEKE